MIQKRFVAILLCACLAAGMTGCGEKEAAEDIQMIQTTTQPYIEPTNEPAEVSADNELTEVPAEDALLTETVDLMEGIELMSVEWNDDFPNHPITGFGVPLFQNVLKQAEQGENILISPMSAWTVLCMVEAGADGETKRQMQDVLKISEGDYLTYAKKFTFLLSQNEDVKVNMANGIWYRNVPYLHVEDYFLQYNKTFFDAAAYKAPFNNDTLQNINNWVSENTDGMIPGILEEINEEDVLYLVNALSFDAEWQTIYNETQVWNDIFTTEDGTEQLVKMLHSEEDYYLEDENATGFLKYYKDSNYAFVGLLPKEGMTVEEYVESLTAEGLNTLLNEKTRTTVETIMPKFSAEYDYDMNTCLQQMGMVDAFDETTADFSKMATSDAGNIYISKVKQKCFIAVDERGTKAGAATAVAMQNRVLSADPEPKVVNLNRPFVYLIIECNQNEPLFMGVVRTVEQ